MFFSEHYLIITVYKAIQQFNERLRSKLLSDRLLPEEEMELVLLSLDDTRIIVSAILNAFALGPNRLLQPIYIHKNRSIEVKSMGVTIRMIPKCSFLVKPLPRHPWIPNSKDRVEVIIKPNTNARIPAYRNRLVFFGHYKAIKSYGAYFLIESGVSAQTAPRVLINRQEAIWSRVNHENLVHMSHAAKKEEMENFVRGRPNAVRGFRAVLFHSELATRFTHEPDSILYHQPNFGTDGVFCLFVQNRYLRDNPGFSTHLGEIRKSLISSFLDQLCHICAREKWWPSDLKLENMGISAQQKVMLGDYYEPSLTHSFYKREDLIDGEVAVFLNQRAYVCINGDQRNDISDRDFSILKNQLYFEILHTCLVFATWPYVYTVLEALMCTPVHFNWDTARLSGVDGDIIPDDKKHEIVPSSLSVLMSRARDLPAFRGSFSELFVNLTNVLRDLNLLSASWNEFRVEDFGWHVDNFRAVEDDISTPMPAPLPAPALSHAVRV